MIIAGQPLALPANPSRLGKESLRRDLASVMLVIAMLTPITEQLASGNSLYDATILLNFGFVVAALIINGFHIPLLALRIAAPFLILCVLGLVSASEKATYYDVLKDVWYVLNPCVAVVAGFLLGALINDFRRLLLCTFIVGIGFALVHIVQFIIDPSVIHESLRSMRQDAGLGEFSSALCLGLLFTLSWNKIPWRRVSLPICVAALPLCGISQVLGLSRVWWVCLLVVCFSATGFLHPRRFNVWVAPLLLAVLLGVAVPLLLPVSSLEGGGAFEIQVKTADSESSSPAGRFLEKVGNSLHEITPRDFTNMTDINGNWRGYESYRGMLLFKSGTWDDMLFGHGFGALTDLGILIRLKTSIYRVIPWFHNGYVFLLVKTGILGLVAYLSFVFLIIRYGMQGYDSPSKATTCLSRVLVGSALSLMLATAVFAGAFNRSRFVTALIFIGAALALQRKFLACEAQLAPGGRSRFRFPRLVAPAFQRNAESMAARPSNPNAASGG